MAVQSAGLLMYRLTAGIEFFLIHPGGPFYKNKNEGYWSIPKGIADENEELLATAIREFTEETGIRSERPYIDVGTAKTKSGKIIHCWAFAGAWNESDGITSNTFTLEWPPSSGKRIEVPEADRAAWFSYDEAVRHINQQQVIFLQRLRQQKNL